MKSMVVLTGASGYVGQAFQRELRRRKIRYAIFDRRAVNLYNAADVAAYINQWRPTFLIHCAGFVGKPNVDACEQHKAECLQANAVLPGVIAAACERLELPWGHVSSGCIYLGRHETGRGFNETDEPNFSFRHNNCSFYSGAKALGEEILHDFNSVYTWRLRVPFEPYDNDRNYLSKIMRYSRLLDVENSLSHLGEFVSACIDCWREKLPFGIYNLVNPGGVTTRQVTEMMREAGWRKPFQFFENEAEFLKIAAATPRSSCVLDTSKATSLGLRLTPIEDILQQCIWQWSPASLPAAA